MATNQEPPSPGSEQTRTPSAPPSPAKADATALPAFSLQRVLVPIDFSDSARRALHYAGALAARFGAQILPLHVVEPVIYPSDMAFAPMAAELPTKVSVTATQNKLRQWCEALLPAGAIEEPVVRIGQPFHEIATAAQELKVDLIILSTHGYTGLKHVLLGSTAERVVRHAPCPVLTVRQP